MQPNAPTELIDLLRTTVVFNGVAVRNLKVRVETVDGCTQMFAVQMPVDPAAEAMDEVAEQTPEQAVLTVLGTLQPGAWMIGKALAEAVGLTYRGGRWGRVLKNLGSKIESHKVHGYRLQ